MAQLSFWSLHSNRRILLGLELHLLRHKLSSKSSQFQKFNMLANFDMWTFGSSLYDSLNTLSICHNDFALIVHELSADFIWNTLTNLLRSRFPISMTWIWFVIFSQVYQLGKQSAKGVKFYVLNYCFFIGSRYRKPAVKEALTPLKIPPKRETAR